MADLPGVTPPEAAPQEQSQADYLWSVAGKKVSLDVSKGAAALLGAFLARTAAYKWGLNVHVEQFQGEVAIATLAGMAWLHDFLKAKFKISWL